MSLSFSNKSWMIRPVEQRQALALSQKYNLSEVASRILVGRGIEVESAQGTLAPTLRGLLPNPSDLLGMDVAVDRLMKARAQGEKIGILGDYDVDGATSTAVLTRFLREVGFDLEFYIPNRVKEGYGPNIQALTHLKEAGASVFVTLDCGTTSFEPLAAAKELGLDVIVVDHHVAEAKLPEAVAVINPNRLDEHA